MSKCDDCKSKEECCLDNKPRTKCFFYSETEEHRIKKSKEYQQGRADTLKECWDKYNKMGYGFFEDWLAEQLKERTE